MPATPAPVMNLRRQIVLPFLNPTTVGALLVLSFFLLQVTLRLLQRETTLDYLYLLMIVQVTPMVISLTRRHFTYIAFVMFSHFSSLSMAKYNVLTHDTNYEVMFPAARAAIQEQIFCSLLMIFVYYAFRMLVFQGVAEKERYQELTLTRNQILVLGLYSLLVPLFIHWLPPWFLIIHFLLLSADMLLLFSSRSPGNELLVAALRATSIVVSITYFLDTGMLTMLGSVIVLTFFIGLLRKAWRMVGFALIFTALICATQTVKNEFRLLIRAQPELTKLDRFSALTELVGLKLFTDNGHGEATWESRWDAILSGFARAGDDSMERVLQLTPKKVPFWGGETYASLPFLFIPRALWKDKPTRHFWNRYGRVYGVLSEDDYQTSVGVSYLAEGYMNFGYVGMYSVAVLVGFLIAFVERFSYIALRGYFYFSFLLYLLPLMPAGTDLGSMLNSLFVMVVLTPFMRQVLLKAALQDDYS